MLPRFVRAAFWSGTGQHCRPAVRNPPWLVIASTLRRGEALVVRAKEPIRETLLCEKDAQQVAAATSTPRTEASENIMDGRTNTNN